jgi:hypothetical protein
MLASDPDPMPHRPKLAPCPHCGANGAACDSVAWLRGRTCCERCNGDHGEAGDDL